MTIICTSFRRIVLACCLLPASFLRYPSLRGWLSAAFGSSCPFFKGIQEHTDELVISLASRAWPWRMLVGYPLRFSRQVVWKGSVIEALRYCLRKQALRSFKTQELLKDPSVITLIPGLLEREEKALKKAGYFLATLPTKKNFIGKCGSVLIGESINFSNSITAVLAHWDPEGLIDPYVQFTCQKLKLQGWKVVIASAGPLNGLVRGQKLPWVDAIVFRTCPGYDFTSWKTALECLPSLYSCNELILCNDSVFGGIGSYGAMHEKMSNISCDFWGATESREQRPHLQSFYLVFRRTVLKHESFKDFFSRVPLTQNRKTAIVFETSLTLWLAKQGFTPAAYIPFNEKHSPSLNPSCEEWREIIEAGVPLLKRELFQKNERKVNLSGWETLLASKGYPIELIINYFKRRGIDLSSTQPNKSNFNKWPPNVCSLQRHFAISPDTCSTNFGKNEKNIGIFFHIFYIELSEELLYYADNLPSCSFVHISTDTEEKRKFILELLEKKGYSHRSEVRVLPNKGWDIAPFLVGYKDRILNYSLILRMHSKRSLHIKGDRGEKWRKMLYTALAGSQERVAAILEQFEQDPSLGMVCPPLEPHYADCVNFGGNFERMKTLLQERGIQITSDLPIDFPMGSMFWCRPQSLQPWLNFSFDDFIPSADEDTQRDGTLAHALERLFFFGCGLTGFTWARIPALLQYPPSEKTKGESMLVFTSCTNNYIPKARVLASTLKHFHPEWTFCLLLGEAPPEGLQIEEEPFDRVVLFDELGIPDYYTWLFRHRVVEICTAAKGPALQYFLEKENYDKVIYLDPDIMVCNSLAPLDTLLDDHDVLLTPHLLAPQKDEQAVRDNEQCALCHGVFNLGFVGVAKRGQGIEFARWWRDRLMRYCYDDIPHGLFTDQRWCDLAPAFFSKLFIIRDPGYNAASWNLTDRTITQRDDGVFMANGSLLRFYHFTGFDSGAGEYMTARYAKSMPAVGKLWDTYRQRLMGFDHAKLSRQRWAFMNFDDGTPITDAMRLLYRDREDLQKAFPNPFLASGYLQWYRNEYFGQPVQKIAHKKDSTPVARVTHTSLKASIAWQIAKNGGFPRALPRLAYKVIAKIRKHGVRSVARSILHGMPLETLASSHQESQEDTPSHLKDILENPLGRKELEKLLATEYRPVCIIEHDWGGGADTYARQRVLNALDKGRAVARLRYTIASQRIELTLCSGKERKKMVLGSLDELLDPRFPSFTEIIVNELAGWYYRLSPVNPHMLEQVKETLCSLVRIKQAHHSLLEFIFHDFFSVCPSITLLQSTVPVRFCGIPPIEACAEGAGCLGQGCIHGLFSMQEWRRAWENFFQQVDRVLFFSENTICLAQKVYTFTEEQICFHPHTVPPFHRREISIPSDGPMRIAIVGDIHPLKGAEYVVNIAKMLKKVAPEASLVVFGNLHSEIIPENITILGPYRRDNLPDLLEEKKVTVGLIPSVCPETFSLVTHELASLQLPLVCFPIGAQGDFVRTLKNSLVASEISASSAIEALIKLDARRKSISL